MKQSDYIVFRMEQPAPTESGYYYCKAPLSKRDTMLVRYVAVHGGSVSVYGDDGLNPLTIYRWFGEVPTCREG
jgi:hypothetical protein